MVTTFSNDIGSTPAMVNRETGEIILNSNVWDTLPKPYQAFILEHEKGHYVLQTTNELEADHYAFNQLAGKSPESLKNTVRVLSDVLPFSNPIHALRLLNMYRIAMCFDYEKEPTTERLTEIRNIEQQILKDFGQIPIFMDYILSKEPVRSMAKYEFPGYDPQNFQPAIGRMFRDFYPSESADQVPFPTSTSPTGSGTGGSTSSPTGALNSRTAEYTESVPLERVPDYQITLTLDLKTVVIVFLVLIAVSILNKL